MFIFIFTEGRLIFFDAKKNIVGVYLIEILLKEKYEIVALWKNKREVLYSIYHVYVHGVEVNFALWTVAHVKKVKRNFKKPFAPFSLYFCYFILFLFFLIIYYVLLTFHNACAFTYIDLYIICTCMCIHVNV